MGGQSGGGGKRVAAWFRRAPVPSLILRDGRIADANESASKLLDVRPTQLVGRKFAEMATTADEQTIASWLSALDIRREAPLDGSTTLLGRGGHAIPATAHLAAVDDEHVMVQLIADTEGITEQLHCERAFRSAVLELGGLAHAPVTDDEFFATFIERAVTVVPGAAAGSILVKQPTGTAYEFAATHGFDLHGLRKYTIEEELLFRDVEDPTAHLIVGYEVPSVIDDEDYAHWILEICRMADIEVSLSAPVHVHGRPVASLSMDNFDDPEAFTATSVEMVTVLAQLLADLFARRTLEGQLRGERAAFQHQALHDELTGAANRRQIEQSLREISFGRGESRGCVAFFVDLDDFKQVNDRYGHDAGDAVLVAIADRLRTAVRGHDIVGRWGGDEFVVLGIDADEATATTVAHRLVSACSRPVAFGDQSIECKVTVGVAWTSDTVKAESMVRRADEALYVAKTAGKNRFELVTV